MSDTEILAYTDSRITELEKEIEQLKAYESHWDEIEEDAKRIAEENTELKTKNNEQTGVILKLNEQIEKMKNKLNCSKYHYCLCKDKTCKDCKDWKMNN